MKKILNLFIMAILATFAIIISNPLELTDEQTQAKETNYVLNNMNKIVEEGINQYIDVDYLLQIQENNKIQTNIALMNQYIDVEEYYSNSLKIIFTETRTMYPTEFSEVEQNVNEFREIIDLINTTNRLMQKTSMSIGTLNTRLIAAGLFAYAAGIITGTLKGAVWTLKARMPFFIKKIIIPGMLIAAGIVILANINHIAEVGKVLVDFLIDTFTDFLKVIRNIIEKIKIKTHTISESLIKKIKNKKLKNEKVFNIAFVININEIEQSKRNKYKSGIKIYDYPKLNYLEALAAGLIIKEGIGKNNFIKNNKSNLEKIILPNFLKRGYNNNPKVTITDGYRKNQIDKYFGIYTESIINAGALAILLGCNDISTYEKHGNGRGYYPHYHDSERTLHIWFRNFY